MTASKSNSTFRPGASALVACALALLVFAPAAAADIQIGSPGSGAGQYEGPRAVAVDAAADRLYVADGGNNRIDVFDAETGAFLGAFGWGVADGVTPEPQVCTTTCFKGLPGGGAGQVDGEQAFSIAVDDDATSPAFHDLYVYNQHRVQRFEPGGNFLRAWGGGVVTGGASGSGDLSAGSATISNVQTTAKRFYVSQTITGTGIPAETRIVSVGNGMVVLSKPATASGTGVALSVAEGAANVPVDEEQVLKEENVTPESKYSLEFTTPAPSQSSGQTATIPTDATATEVQAALVALPSISFGDVSVSGPAGGPYQITFEGRYADTDVTPLVPHFNSLNVELSTVRNGSSSPELCTAVNAGDCTAGIDGTEPGQFQDSGSLATGPGGNVYVADSTRLRESEFNNRVQTFTPSGVFVESTLFPTVEHSVVGSGVDSSGDFYVATGGVGVHKYHPDGTPYGAPYPLDSSLNIAGLALDGSGDLFVSDNTRVFGDGSIGAETAIYEYGPSGVPIRTLYGNGTLINRTISLAPFSNINGDLFAVEGPTFGHPPRVVQLAFPPPGPVIPGDPGLLKASPVGNVRATLHATVNPEGKETTVRFEYVDQASFENEGGFASPNTQLSEPSAPTPADFKLHEASAQTPCDSNAPLEPGCLEPETLYHFRAVAENEDSPPGGVKSPEATFETKPPAELGDAWSTDVGTDTAVLHATLDPLSLPYEGHFEYVDEASFGESGFAGAARVPAAGSIDFGSGEAPVTRGVPLLGLRPGTSYRYRLVVSNPFFGAFTGQTEELRTFAASEARPPCANDALRAGASAALADCRAYEMVSPVEKENGDVVSPASGENSTLASYFQSSAAGSALSYSSARAFAEPQSAPYVSQYLAKRGEESWTSRSISPPGETNVKAGNDTTLLYNQFKVFSADLSSAWLWQYKDPPLGNPPGVASFRNLYRRDNGSDAYEALTGVTPSVTAPGQYLPVLQGVSADGSKAVYAANDRLSANAAACPAPPAPCKYQLYEFAGNASAPRLVSVMPNGSASELENVAGGGGSVSSTSSFVPYYNENVSHAMSEDGSRIYWSAFGGSGGTGQIYLRLNGNTTLHVSDAVSSEPALFRQASADGSRAIYTFEAGPKSRDLYEYDLGSKKSTLLAEGVSGIAGASEDLARIYLVSSDVLSAEPNSHGDHAAAGKPNLYLYEGGAGGGIRFVAELEGAEFGHDNAAQSSPFRRTSRVSADGSEIAFMSSRRLTDYDNADAANGKPATEVYLYSADSKRLSCASCNPSGARPQGRLYDATHLGPYKARYAGAQVASQIPGWEDSLYANRVLSANGRRLFFESYDALVPGDTNGAGDVYQWEAAGEGECDAARADYFAANGGCVSLISSGKSAGDSEFADAGESGDDVFFTTESSLVPQDPGLIDVYDARVDGGLPPPPPGATECEGEACQSPPEAPSDPTPASAAFEGSGNVTEGGPRPRCRKPRVRRHGRCVAGHRHKAAKRGRKGTQ